MARTVRKFTSNGIEYIDAPAGRLKAAKDDWNIKLTGAGHRMVWKKTGPDSYCGDCKTCGGNVICGSAFSSCQGPHDIRHKRCQPEGNEMTADPDRILNQIDGLIGRDGSVSNDAMRWAPKPIEDDGSPFGEVIDVYTRADAIADGSQVEVPADIVRDAGIAVPVSVTRAVWEDCVAWTDVDAERTGAYQDETGRLWDVVWMGFQAAKRARPTGPERIRFRIVRVARDARTGRDGDVEPTEVPLVIVLGADFDGSPCITIMRIDED